MTVDHSGLLNGLKLNATTGLWHAAHRSGSVSYPAQGNARYLAIEDRSFWFRHRNRCIVSMVRRFPPEGVFLDVGGGNGYVARSLTAAGFSCAVLEPGLAGALAARARSLEPVICARLEDIAISPASLGAAGLFDVLEHIEDEAAMLRRIHTLIRPGGTLVLTVPSYPCLMSNADVAAGHYRRYTNHGLARTLTACGFRVAFLTHMFFPLPPITFLLRTLPSRLGWCRTGGANRPASEGSLDADNESVSRLDGEICDEEDHVLPVLTTRVIDTLLDSEFCWIERGRVVPMGSSGLCVAIRP